MQNEPGEGNNNNVDNDDGRSVDSGNVFCGDGEGSSDNDDNKIRLHKGEHTVTLHTESHTVLNGLDDAKYVGCNNDSFSVVDENNLSVADGSGDIWGPIENLANTSADDLWEYNLHLEQPFKLIELALDR